MKASPPIRVGVVPGAVLVLVEDTPPGKEDTEEMEAVVLLVLDALDLPCKH